MLFLIVVAASLVAGPCTGRHVGRSQSDGDANIFRPVLQSLLELEERARSPSVSTLQRASSVCYEEVGCFDKETTFKHLKQLPESPDEIDTRFLLYTRRNPQEAQVLDYRRPETVRESLLDPSKPLKFVSHGFGGRGNLTWVRQMKDAFLKMHDVNVIVLDWSFGARAPYYIQASVNSELVGAQAAVLYYLIKDELGIQEKDLHLVGFSLGAQVVGFMGKRMRKMRGTLPARITGLDPASPLFEDYGGDVHLYKEDGDLVDVIHTNADLLLYGGMGMGSAIGHVDFYPNGGKRQPGCTSTLKGAITDMISGERERTCNHERAVHLFIDSVLNPDGCEYVGFKCANYTEFSGAKCMSCGQDCATMGYRVKGTGTYYLMTKAEQPFCSDLAKLTIHFDKFVKRSYGSIVVTLVGANDLKENATMTEKDEKLVGGASRVAAIAMSDGMRPLKSVSVLYTKFNGWITKGTDTFALAELHIEDAQGNTVFKSCETTIGLTDNQYTTLSNAC